MLTSGTLNVVLAFQQNITWPVPNVCLIKSYIGNIVLQTQTK